MLLQRQHPQENQDPIEESLDGSDFCQRPRDHARTQSRLTTITLALIYQGKKKDSNAHTLFNHFFILTPSLCWRLICISKLIVSACNWKLCLPLFKWMSKRRYAGNKHRKGTSYKRGGGIRVMRQHEILVKYKELER